VPVDKIDKLLFFFWLTLSCVCSRPGVTKGFPAVGAVFLRSAIVADVGNEPRLVANILKKEESAWVD
jgi:hypothetical protein